MTQALWRAVIRPLLFRLDPELAHRLAFGVLRALFAVPGVRSLSARRGRRPDPALRTDVLGLTFPSPVGLAAGFDKDAAGYRALGALGFGFVEVGTVTPRPQPGNPRPRLFRLPADRALLNRMGFNNEGMEAAARRLARRGEEIVGVNVGRNKDSEDAVADYVAVNVSSPNTAGLRDLQRADALRPLLAAVRAATDRPVLVKLAPDLDDEAIDAVADLALDLGVDGIIATNTTISRAGLETDAEALGAGGISGAPLHDQALHVLRRLRARVGDRLVLVAAGGIETADDAWRRIRAGATLVQLYTGFVYGGPGTARRVAAWLAGRARAEGFTMVQDAVGADMPAVDRAPPAPTRREAR